MALPFCFHISTSNHQLPDELAEMALPFCFHISTSNHQLPDELAIEDKWCTR